MKRMSFLIIVAALLSGCATYTVHERDGRKLALVENSGWYLFNAIPIVGGDPDHPNEDETKWFTDVVTLEGNMKLLEAAMKENGATAVENVTSYFNDEAFFMIFFKRHVYRTSAELIDKPSQQ